MELRPARPDAARGDIEPNLAYLLARFMRFAVSPAALWSGNFRDLLALVTRMATLPESGLIFDADVDDEIARLTRCTLFAVSRAARAPNDAGRLKKYLARFNLDWEQVSN